MAEGRRVNVSPRRFFGEVSQRAAAQHTVLALDDLRGLGVPVRTVQRWAADGRLHRYYRGVYGLVPFEALSVSGRRFAAVLACGPGAALSRRIAADQHAVRRTTRARIDVIVPERNRTGGHAGIDLHRSRTLTGADIVTVDGIPTTSVARTLLDLAAVVRPEELERPLNQAEALGVFDLRAIDDQLARNPSHPGAAPLRSALERYRTEAAPTESGGEDELLALVRRAGLPEPERQAYLPLGPGERPVRVDFLWRAQRLVVEVDSQRWHGTRAAFESDRRRDALLQLAGWRVLRIPARQVLSDPAGVIRLIARMLAATEGVG